VRDEDVNAIVRDRGKVRDCTKIAPGRRRIEPEGICGEDVRVLDATDGDTDLAIGIPKPEDAVVDGVAFCVRKLVASDFDDVEVETKTF
jgi:hypothetical protein